MSPVLCTKDESLDWTEITKSGTRQIEVRLSMHIVHCMSNWWGNFYDPQIQNWQSKVYLKLTFIRTFAFHGWTIKDVDLSRKIKSNLFIRRSFCRIVELSSSSGSKSIENPKSDLLKQWKTSQFDIWRILINSTFLVTLLQTKKSKQVRKELLQKNWGRLFLMNTLEIEFISI